MKRYSTVVSLFVLLTVCSPVRAEGLAFVDAKTGVIEVSSERGHQVVSSTFADTGFNGDVLALTTYGSDLIAGGKFFTAGGVASARVAGWDGSAWYSMSGLPFGPEVYSLHQFNGELYAGTFLQTLYKWTGSDWVSFGPDLAPNNSWGQIRAMETYNDSLYIAGHFRFDTLQPPYIAKWNGVTWDSVANGIVGKVEALTLYNGELVAGGWFTTAAGSAGDRIAKWNGTTWSAIGTGISASTGNNNPNINAVTEYSGNLVAAGNFEMAGGNNALNIAIWNGFSWQQLGSGFNDQVFALIVHDNFLFAAGAFTMSGGATVNFIGRWNGGGWDQVGQLDSTVFALHEYNGKLVAGGAFQTAGGGHVAWWDGVNWRPMSDVPTDIGDDVAAQRPEDFSLGQNYPNPFNPSTVIEFRLSQPSVTRIDVFNIRGQFVAGLINQTVSAGVHTVVWDGKDNHRREVSSGVYFYRLTTDRQTVSRKMIFMK
jgi:hypothetical protein